MLVAQLCQTLCNPMDCSPPGSSAHGIIPVRILKWLPFPSPGFSQPKDWIQASHTAGRFFTTEPPVRPPLFCSKSYGSEIWKAHITWVLSCRYSQILVGAARVWKLDRLDTQNNSFTKLIVIVGFLLGIHLSCWTGVCPYMTFLSCGSQHSWTFFTITQGSINQCPRS